MNSSPVLRRAGRSAPQWHWLNSSSIVLLVSPKVAFYRSSKTCVPGDTHFSPESTCLFGLFASQLVVWISISSMIVSISDLAANPSSWFTWCLANSQFAWMCETCGSGVSKMCVHLGNRQMVVKTLAGWIRLPAPSRIVKVRQSLLKNFQMGWFSGVASNGFS